MRFKKYTSLLLTTTVFFQSLLPVFAMERPLEEHCPFFPSLELSSSLHAPLTAPSQHGKTAAGILHYSLWDGEIHILLGKRNDGHDPKGGEWCNFGGRSEGKGQSSIPFDKGKGEKSVLHPESWPTLATDAARESAEESNGVYAPHPRLLRHRPFIDLWQHKHQGSLLYRMYWQQVQYVPAAIFLQKLQEANQGHNKEYTDFRWIAAKEIRRAVESNNPLIDQEGKKLGIYAPLFATLSTASGKAFLKQLEETGKLNRFHKDTRPFLNRLYTLGEAERRELHSPYAALETDDHDDTLAEAVAAHGMAMVALKERQLAKDRVKEAQEREAERRTHNILPDDTISRIHLRIVLGPDYRFPTAFQGEVNPRRAADLANIRTYFDLYNSVEFTQKGQVEFKRKINLLPSDYELFADVLAWEEYNSPWPTFFHGASATLNNLFKSFTFLRELLSLTSFDDLMALRGTDIYFKNAATLHEMLQTAGNRESEETRSAMLFTNFALLAGLRTTRSTSSSAEYVINDHSVKEPNLTDRFEEALALAGFSKPTYAYFQSIFEQFVKYKHSSLANSVLVAISQNPQDLDLYNYATGGGGRYYAIKSTSQILKNIQDEKRRQEQDGIEPFERDSEKKRALFPENRLFLHPARLVNPTQTRLKSFDRFPLSGQEKQAYEQEMRRTAVAMLADWLAQKTAVLEGSFFAYPALKTLYKTVYKGVTGHDFSERFSSEGFIHLVRNGHLEAVKGYIANDPQILSHKEIEPGTLINASLDSNTPKLVDYLLKEVLKSSLDALLSPEDVMSTVRMLLWKEHDKAFFYLLTSYDLSRIPDPIKLQWMEIIGTARPDLASQYLLLFHQRSPHLKEKALSTMIRNPQIFSRQLKKIFFELPVDSQYLLEELCTHIDRGALTTAGEIEDKVLLFMNNGANILKIHPLTKDPLIFMVSAIPGLSLDWINKLPYNSGVLDLRNREELNILQFLQKNTYEKQAPWYHLQPIETMYREAKRDPFKESYSPFIDLFGSASILWDCSISFGFPPNQRWIDRLQKSKTLDDLRDLFKNCPDPYFFLIFSNKIQDKMRTAIGAIQAEWEQARLLAVRKREAWFQELENVLRAADLSQIDKLKDTLPPTLPPHEFNWTTWEMDWPSSFPYDLLEHEIFKKELRPLIEKNQTAWLTEASAWLEDLEKLHSRSERSQDILNHIHNMPDCAAYLRKAQEMIRYGLKIDIWKESDNIRAKKKSWMERTRQLLIQMPTAIEELNEHLDKASLFITQESLEMLLDDRFAGVLPAVLRKVYADEEKDGFIRDMLKINCRGLEESYWTSPISHIIAHNHEKVLDIVFEFCGWERLFALFSQLDNDTFCQLLEILPNDKLTLLYEAASPLFSLKNKKQDFLRYSLECSPFSLKRKIVSRNFERLNEIEQEYYIPYFWLLFNDGENLPLVEECVQRDPTLLHLKTPEGLGIESFLELLPKTQMTNLLRKHLAMEKAGKASSGQEDGGLISPERPSLTQ